MTEPRSGAFSVRKATPDDAAGILDCLRSAFETYRENYTADAYRETVLTAETIAARLASMSVFVAASDSGEVVGTLACAVAHGNEGHLRGMAVRPAWQGSGVAARLLAVVESELRAQKCTQMRLDTTAPLSRAIRFYEKHGFRASGRTSDFFGMPLFEYVRCLSGLRVRFIGSGDAFGSGGRFQTCIGVAREDRVVLLDCGASSLVAMKQIGLDPGAVDAIVLSHFHGDHFGGVPFFVLDAQFRRRTRPLVIAGPAGVGARVRDLMESSFPGSWSSRKPFELELVELSERPAELAAGARVQAWPVVHTPGSSPHAVRLTWGDVSVSYSGDTEWTDALVDVADAADLFVAEAYTCDKPVRFHLSFADIARERARLRCRRLVLTHLGPEMLANLHRAADVDAAVAADGLSLEIA
jgi:ribonuclease BN (tRNA processing enzyme)/GNAT superfamily N-acetyltransferase